MTDQRQAGVGQDDAPKPIHHPDLSQLPPPNSPEHQDLLQFLYQFPVGVISLAKDGSVVTINPAASRFLSPEVQPGESLVRPTSLLRRLVPGLMGQAMSDPDRLGIVATEHRQVVDGVDGATRFEVTAYRVRRDQLLIAMTDVSEERRILIEQRERAERLQRALLGHIDHHDLALSVAYVPAHGDDLAGGDWYDVIGLVDGWYGLVVGDVVGHDIEASAAMGQLRALVRAHALLAEDPAQVLGRTESVARNIDSAVCATLNYVRVEPKSGELRFSSAGHPPPLVVRGNGESSFLTGGRRPALAALPNPPSNVATDRLTPGDLLVLYTDGLIEQPGESLDVGFDRLVQKSSDLIRGSSDDVASRLVEAMVPNGAQRDDICVLALRQS